MIIDMISDRGPEDGGDSFSIARAPFAEPGRRAEFLRRPKSSAEDLSVVLAFFRRHVGQHRVGAYTDPACRNLVHGAAPAPAVRRPWRCAGQAIEAHRRPRWGARGGLREFYYNDAFPHDMDQFNTQQSCTWARRSCNTSKHGGTARKRVVGLVRTLAGEVHVTIQASDIGVMGTWFRGSGRRLVYAPPRPRRRRDRSRETPLMSGGGAAARQRPRRLARRHPSPLIADSWPLPGPGRIRSLHPPLLCVTTNGGAGASDCARSTRSSSSTEFQRPVLIAHLRKPDFPRNSTASSRRKSAVRRREKMSA